MFRSDSLRCHKLEGMSGRHNKVTEFMQLEPHYKYFLRLESSKAKFFRLPVYLSRRTDDSNTYTLPNIYVSCLRRGFYKSSLFPFSAFMGRFSAGPDAGQSSPYLTDFFKRDRRRAQRPPGVFQNTRYIYFQMSRSISAL